VSVVERNKELEPRQLLEALFADVREFTRGAPQSDDITAMVLRYGL
jgi:serine phosphatase RsbU (regulator of sigma subunit)